MAQGKRNDPTVEPTDADRWYAAGFIDGEGCITVRQSPGTRNHKTWNPSMYASVTVSQVDPRPLQWMQQRWGGSLRPLSRKRGKERDAWEWTVVGRQAFAILEDIRDMLKVKDAQADNALRLRNGRRRGMTGHTRSLTEEELSMQADVLAEARRLNQRGQEWLELPAPGTLGAHWNEAVRASFPFRLPEV